LPKYSNIATQKRDFPIKAKSYQNIK